MPKRMLLYPLIFMLLAACAGYQPPRYDPALYPHRYKGYDLALSWKTGLEGGNLTVEGLVRNNRNAYLRGLELTLELLDSEGRRLSAATFFSIPDLVQLDEIRPFDLKLPVPPGSAPKRLRFLYKYYELWEGGSGGLYFHTFEADL